MEKHEHKHHEAHKHHEKSRSSNTKLWIMAVALGLLIVISAVQAVGLVSLKNRLDNEITTLASTSKSTVSTGGESLSKNLENLPSMVGGC
ncbi:MAG: hypothetical protein QF655_03935 [Candidatus Woesearchaeota archaeon]|jgi:hypothetical protein|nr:hypothetical protein [Candidatus Woesearchaeota archaeon]MDP6265197.1 hypothetical protein [Candidatus Woesearchaeota archaeon]MDP7323026.1 hypothetical protein [Candidatus Woesearchaeota archaeon]MDP7476752.1 hypothetical protein [Candidatus Woesearchaeota archaeon]HJO01557.1 hypothetical protein [Candidatus Woesearchaeota archaeon]|tara:strand:+ start:768 stop:1037 length:270 start_codon:yes stop_codon:yes gene_type:complete